MAYDGIVTFGIAKELSELLTLGKIEKVYQPGSEELVLQIHTKDGNHRLFLSSNSQSARVCLTDKKYKNPEQAPTFCMLMRKHIQGGRITNIRQYESERILEFDIEAQNELGFTVCKRLIVEIMGKHSNIALVDIESGKLIDSIKRISIDVNRYRQLLPGVIYQYPPKQDKIGFRELGKFEKSEEFRKAGELEASEESKKAGELGELPRDAKLLMSMVGGISPAIAREMETGKPADVLCQILQDIEDGRSRPRIYFDGDKPLEFHLTKLSEYEGLETKYYDSLSECVEEYFFNRESSNMVKQKSVPLQKTVQAALDKARLKKKKLGEDLINAENSEKYRLYGEILTANIHLVPHGARKVTLTNYYDGKEIEIPLDEKLSPSKNAQKFFKKYSKAKTAIHEKQTQLEENEQDILYLESVLHNVNMADTEDELESIREELASSGYVRIRNKAGARKRKYKPSPVRYTLSDGTEVLVGRNNTENDWLTMKYAAKNDVWMHTKDIPGSHVIIRMENGRSVDELSAELIYEAAGIAAYHSKAQGSSQVPVDYVPIRYVKKPNGAKPGMVIFTHNLTVYVDPKLPKNI